MPGTIKPSSKRKPCLFLVAFRAPELRCSQYQPPLHVVKAKGTRFRLVAFAFHTCVRTAHAELAGVPVRVWPGAWWY